MVISIVIFSHVNFKKLNFRFNIGLQTRNWRIKFNGECNSQESTLNSDNYISKG
jgi:hypothetical protein